MKILFSTQEKNNKPEKLIYFDNFSGPGIYYINEEKNETCNGSPLIVANIANKYIEEKQDREFIIYCIDCNKSYVNLLAKYLSSINIYNQDWNVHHAEFDNKIHEILCELEKNKFVEQPMFFFIDPFGYSGYPLNTIKRLLKYPRVELFINFMIYDIIRFCEGEKSEYNMISLFGNSEFKKISSLYNPEEKQNFIINLYYNSLKNSGANFVMPFRINTPYKGTRPKYYLIHASKHFKALKIMKDNMAKISDKPYNFEAIGIATEQMSLFEDPDKVVLKERIAILINEGYPYSLDYKYIEEWSYENTNGVSKTIKETLIELESENRIIIKRKPRQLRNTVTNGAKIKYIK